MGAVVQVKVLGVMALIDEGEHSVVLSIPPPLRYCTHASHRGRS